MSPAGTILDQAHSLQDMLHDEEQDFEDGVVWAAVYDPVQKLLHRHNEASGGVPARLRSKLTLAKRLLVPMLPGSHSCCC